MSLRLDIAKVVESLRALDVDPTKRVAGLLEQFLALDNRALELLPQATNRIKLLLEWPQLLSMGQLKAAMTALPAPTPYQNIGEINYINGEEYLCITVPRLQRSLAYPGNVCFAKSCYTVYNLEAQGAIVSINGASLTAGTVRAQRIDIAGYLDAWSVHAGDGSIVVRGGDLTAGWEIFAHDNIMVAGDVVARKGNIVALDRIWAGGEIRVYGCEGPFIRASLLTRARGLRRNKSPAVTAQRIEGRLQPKVNRLITKNPEVPLPKDPLKLERELSH